ncbi:MAG: 7-cyano-7-deazaguanine synthase QueC [Parvularculales bacterium]
MSSSSVHSSTGKVLTSSDKALILFSGGQDSTICLGWALEHYNHVETIGFEYGQRHNVELACRAAIRKKLTDDFPLWADRLGADHIVNLSFFKELGDSALTTHDKPIKVSNEGLPTTFVPGRNLIFFTTAAALGWQLGIYHLVGGMCETDTTGYPDCRQDALEMLNQTINLGMGQDFVMQMPLVLSSKAKSWQLAHTLGGETFVELVREESHTCYRGDRRHAHEWGYGCGDCPACKLRAQGYEEWRRKSHV